MQARYETLLLLNPEIGSDGSKELVEKFSGVLERNEGQVIKNDDWGLKTLAYPVKKQKPWPTPSRNRPAAATYAWSIHCLPPRSRNSNVISGYLTVYLNF